MLRVHFFSVYSRLRRQTKQGPVSNDYIQQITGVERAGFWDR